MLYYNYIYIPLHILCQSLLHIWIMKYRLDSSKILCICVFMLRCNVTLVLSLDCLLRFSFSYFSFSSHWKPLLWVAQCLMQVVI